MTSRPRCSEEAQKPRRISLSPTPLNLSRTSTTQLRNEAIHEARAGHDADPPTIPTLSAYASEIPDQAEFARGSAPSRDIEKTTVLPVVVDNLPAIIDKRPLARIGERAEPRAARQAQSPPLDTSGRALGGRTHRRARLALTGGAWQWNSSKNNNLNNVAALDPDSRDIVDPSAQFGDENFLIVGTDSRYGSNSEMGAGDTEDAGGTRSDTVMLVNIQPTANASSRCPVPRSVHHADGVRTLEPRDRAVRAAL